MFRLVQAGSIEREAERQDLEKPNEVERPERMSSSNSADSTEGNVCFFSQPSTTFLSNLNDLRLRGELCDVTLVVEGVHFPAHKVVLSAFSPYFKSMFLGSLAESKQNSVTLNGLEPDILSLLMDYVYTNTVLISRSNVQSLLSGANLLQVIPVKEAACAFLESHMDCSNCIGIHCFAELLSCSDLKNKAKDYALLYFELVFQQEEFLKLPFEKVLELTMDDRLRVPKEETVFEAIYLWYTFDAENRGTCFPKLLETVRLGLVSPYFIVDRIEDTVVVSKSPECMKLTGEAKLFHLLPDRKRTGSTVNSRPRLSSDTKQVIIAVGGEDEKVVLRAVEYYNPTRNTWRSLACLPFAISKHGLAASGRNTMYLAGGEYPDGTASSSVWRYESALDTWQKLEPLSVGRSELGLVMLDGLLYAVGGWSGTTRLNTVECYDPRLNKWTHVAPMRTSVSAPAVLAFEGKLFVTGGALLQEGDSIELAHWYDPKTNTWSESAPMNCARSGAAICSLGSLIYVAGGWHAPDGNTKIVEVYDPKKNSWEMMEPMCEPRYRPGMAVLDDKIYVFGGEGGWEKYHDSIEAYDLKANEWAMCGKLLTARSWLSCVTLHLAADA